MIQAICPSCGSCKVLGYEESETEFILECFSCGESEIKNTEEENRPSVLFKEWFF